MSKWTNFWDMHSGGGQKEQWAQIFIEAPEEQAKLVFYNRFGHSPDRVTCTCCGSDYSVSEYDTLEEATDFHSNHRGKKQTFEEYITSDGCLVVYAKDIKEDEKQGWLPKQGYVWVDE